MGALHIMQVMDWKKFTLEEWLQQVGAWFDQPGIFSMTTGLAINPIAIAMQQAEKSITVKRLSKTKRREILASWFLSDEPMRQSRARIECKITDDESRAIQQLILDMMGQSEVLDGWLDVVKARYFRGLSLSKLVSAERTLMDVKFDLRCGLAAIHARYPHIRHELAKKST